MLSVDFLLLDLQHAIDCLVSEIIVLCKSIEVQTYFIFSDSLTSHVFGKQDGKARQSSKLRGKIRSCPILPPA